MDRSVLNLAIGILVVGIVLTIIFKILQFALAFVFVIGAPLLILGLIFSGVGIAISVVVGVVVVLIVGSIMPFLVPLIIAAIIAGVLIKGI